MNNSLNCLTLVSKMKRLLSLFLILLLPLTSCGNKVLPDNPAYPSIFISSGHAFVYDIATNELILYSNDDTNRIYPASITKLLTALYALEIMPESYLITPGDEVYFPPDGASSAYIRPNHILTLEMLIEGMMLPSGNDAAYAIAAAGGRLIAEDDLLMPEKAVALFVEGMNEFAKSLGCMDTHFTTPDGYAGDEHYSTTGDIAVIAKKASQNETIMKYAGMLSDNVTYASGHTNTWTNTNKFLDPSSKYFNEHVTGLKTGSLVNNYSMITIYIDDNVQIIIGVFGCPTDDDRYKDTINFIKQYTKS